MQVVKFIGCLKKLKFRLFSLSCTQPRKRKEKVNLKERKRNPGFAFFCQEDSEFEGGKTMRYEFEKTMSEAGEWRDRESENNFFLPLFLVSVWYAFTGQNTIFYPIWPKWSGVGWYLNQNKTTMFLYRRRYHNGKY